MNPTDLSEALTAAEARRVVLAFAEAIWRCDESPDLATLLRDLSQTADLLVGLAYGELLAEITDGIGRDVWRYNGKNYHELRNAQAAAEADVRRSNA